MKESDNFSEDVKYWAEYKTGIREFKPWLESAEGKSTGGLAKPQTLDEANGMYAKVKEFEDSCLKHLKVLLTSCDETYNYFNRIANKRGNNFKFFHHTEDVNHGNWVHTLP